MSDSGGTAPRLLVDGSDAGNGASGKVKVVTLAESVSTFTADEV